jgi:hypothetical protein
MLPKERGNALAAIHEICQALSTASGKRVTIGMMPVATLRSHTEDYGGEPLSARETLTAVLTKIDPQLTWRLFYDPAVGWYGLNIQLVPLRSTPMKAAPTIAK